MKRLISLLLLCGVISLGVLARAATDTPMAHKFEQVAPGVYAAIGNGTIQTASNSVVIINNNDVVLVDTHVTPEATRRLVNDIKTLTDKPIKYVINTHWHYDHTDGNQIFAKDVQIIGHENTRKEIIAGVLQTRLDQAFADLPAALDNLRKQIAAEQDPARKAAVQQRLAVQDAYREQLKETKPTPPNVTFTDRKTIKSGAREIQLIYPGRGHTDTDVIVYLPKEKVICTGDFFEGPATGALNFGFHDEWANNLEKLKAIDYDVTIPGHGEPFNGKERIDYFESFLRDLWQQTKALHDQKVPTAEAAKRVDLTAHKAHYQNINGPGFQEATIARIYDVLDQRAK